MEVRHGPRQAGRAPRSAVRFCDFLSRSNEARREFTWAEVTLLEALRFSPYAGREWDTCVEIVSDGSAVKRLGPDALMRRDALREVGESEPRASGMFRRRLRSLTDAMPATVAAAAARPLGCGRAEMAVQVEDPVSR